MGAMYSYDETNGKILVVMRGNLDHVKQNQRGGILVEYKGPEIDPAKHYRKRGKIINRPTITIPKKAKVGVKKVIKGVPVGAKITLGNGGAASNKSGDIELLFDGEGEFEVTIVPDFPYAISKAVVSVTA